MIESITYKTTVLRALSALVGGAVVGGSLTMTLVIFVLGPPAPNEYILIWLAISAYWMAGLWVFAVIPWALFHYLGLRQWYILTMQGMATMVVVGLFLFAGVSDINGLSIITPIGGIVGWTIWRIAYRRALITGENK